MAGALSVRPANNDFEGYDPGHQDILTALDYNHYGTRKVTGSTDHRLKVFDWQSDGSWKLIATWRGHDAEILRAKWGSPAMGQIIGSIGEDQRFKIWEEDIYEPPNSSHRFKCIFTLQSPSRIPYVSFDFKSTKYNGMHLALLSRDALLTIYEADEPESLSSWNPIDQFHVCAPPVRGEETTFKVQFEPNPNPSWKACVAGSREKIISLITAGMNTVKIWRTSSRSSRHFHLAADLSANHHSLVRDVSWALLNTRGYDLIATTCKDGTIRIFEIHYPDSPSWSEEENDTNPLPPAIQAPTALPSPRSPSFNPPNARNHPSSSSSRLSANLASTTKHPPEIRRHEVLGPVPHIIREVATMQEDHSQGGGGSGGSGAWQVKWRSNVFEGMELLTSHDDGSLKIWKKTAARDGGWVEFAGLETGAVSSSSS